MTVLPDRIVSGGIIHSNILVKKSFRTSPPDWACATEIEDWKSEETGAVPQSVSSGPDWPSSDCLVADGEPGGLACIGDESWGFVNDGGSGGGATSAPDTRCCKPDLYSGIHSSVLASLDQTNDRSLKEPAFRRVEICSSENGPFRSSEITANQS